MFSFVGDTVVDPFAGTGSTALAAIETGRHSINVEVDPGYMDLMETRLRTSKPGAKLTFERPDTNNPEPTLDCPH
jgi:modification methylase